MSSSSAVVGGDVGCTIHHLPPIEINFQLNDNYPQSSGVDVVDISCAWMSSSQVDLLAAALRQEWQAGEVVLYAWYELVSNNWRTILGMSSEKLVGCCLCLEKVVFPTPPKLASLHHPSPLVYPCMG